MERGCSGCCGCCGFLFLFCAALWTVMVPPALVVRQGEVVVLFFLLLLLGFPVAARKVVVDANFKGVIALPRQSHRADLVPTRRHIRMFLVFLLLVFLFIVHAVVMLLLLLLLLLRAGAALAADVDRVAQVPAGRALANVVL